MLTKLTIREWFLSIPVLITWFILNNWNRQYADAKKKQDGKNVYKLKARLRLVQRLVDLTGKIVRPFY